MHGAVPGMRAPPDRRRWQGNIVRIFRIADRRVGVKRARGLKAVAGQPCDDYHFYTKIAALAVSFYTHMFMIRAPGNISKS